MKRFSTLLLVLVAAGGALGYGFYRQHRTQVQLNAQLCQLDQLLAADNEDADWRTDGAVKGIAAAVVKNQNQPHEVALLAAARHLNSRADSLAQTLRGLADDLRRASGNAGPLPSLAHLGKTGGVDKLLGPASAARQGLQQQLSGYRAALQALHPTERAALAGPPAAAGPVGAALASLTQLESEVRAAEWHTLQYLTPKVGARSLRSHLVALYTAESNTVAPGTTYRAHLFLGSILALRAVPLHMRCNGRLVAADTSGVGQVRFRVSEKPGPAAWTGTICLNANGRDTTFQVRVPYRVARR